MNNDLSYIESLIRVPKYTATLIKSNYDTSDIVRAILEADKTAYKDVINFAANGYRGNALDYCKSLFNFIVSKINYKEDEPGQQLVKMPARLMKEKQGDCKSFSIFAAACFKALHIPYSYRFVSFSALPIYTHVYLIIHLPGQDIIFDTVYKKFNQQKKYTFKKDIRMKGLYRMAGTPNPSGVLNLPDKKELTFADLDAAILKQRYEIERNLMAGIGGHLGLAKAAEYDQGLQVINAFVGAIHSDDYESAENIVNGLPDGVGKTILRKVLDKAKQVVTAPAALPVKALLEASLPKAAPFFLYLFIPDAEVSKYPEKVQKKRAKITKIANFIVNGVGMKREHLNGILYNGILKRYGKKPEAVLAEMFKGKALAGIGIITDIIETVIKIISAISKLFKKEKAETVSSGDAPDASDFETMTPNQVQQATNNLKQKSSGNTLDDIYNNGSGKVKSIC